jgi:hypothetical protein
MPSTYTPSGVELIAAGEQSGTWNVTTNRNLQILNRMISEAGAIALSGTTHTLTVSDGALSDGQYGVLVFTGSPSGTNTVTISPSTAQRTFIVRNTTAQSVVLTQGSGGNVTVASGRSAIVYCDGAGASALVFDVTALLVPVLANAGVTASASELNVLDGITASTAELNILDGVTASTAELNILDGVTVSTAEINLISGITTAGQALIDDADAAAQRTTLGLGTGATLDEVTTAQWRDNTADKLLSTDQVWDSMAEVTLTDSANIALNMSTGFDFVVTLEGNRTLDNPTNTKVGQRGRIRVVQDGTGSRTLAFGNNYEFANGTAQTLTITANAQDILYYDVISATRILITFVRNIS